VPDAVVLVATVRSLKMHGGGPEVVAGKPLAEEYQQENIELLTKGCCNMQQHIRNARKFGLPVVVAVNRFSSDTDAEMNVVRQMALNAGAMDAIACDHWAKGGEGAVDLAKAVVHACDSQHDFKFLYDVSLPIETKIETIAKEMYGADGIELSDLAKSKIETYTKQVRKIFLRGVFTVGFFNQTLILVLGLLQSTNMYGKDSFKLFSRSQAKGGTFWVYCPRQRH
jgi:methylenetetrahydrofolate dehydrogenase (NADP+)/methenyltetrahydrofolate cyclohydrolase/formyltetrahydrofolate synthetase